MSRYFIHMAYDGSAYCGWQIQPKELTVQEVMEKALSTLLQSKIALSGAGRTDTGVHASQFVAHFDLNTVQLSDAHFVIDSNQFIFKLNRFLPPDIVVYKIHEVSEDMHARYSATYRTYHYHISTIKPLYNRNFTHHVYGELNCESINKCCEVLMNTTDFTSFAKLHTDVKTNNCIVSQARWNTVEGGYLFEITANRFLRNMVRSITGTLLDVGRGKLDPDGFTKIVEAKDRGKAGTSAPASGLFLVDIGYSFPEE